MLTITAPNFAGSGAVNSGMVRLRFSEPDERKRSQQELANYISKITRNYPEARTFAIQQQTISMGGVGGFTGSVCITAHQTFEKTEGKAACFPGRSQ